MKAFLFVTLLMGFSFSPAAFANGQETDDSSNILDELNPFDPNIEQKLKELDQEYEAETGLPAILDDMSYFGLPNCYRKECKVWAQVVKSEQRMYLYVDGSVVGIYDVSTGTNGYETPDFDKHPNGRIYDKYTSTKYPGGDYQNLGNMPYAVFIEGGFAIHGTGQGNWRKLGRRASHGCIRLHPDNAFIFNRLVRQHGIRQVWITVE